MGDFNIDIGISNSDYDKSEKFCSLFNLKSLIKKDKSHKSIIVLVLTKKTLPFQSCSVTETGLSVYYKLIATSVKSHFTKHDPKTVYDRNFKNLMKTPFLNHLKETNFDLSTNDPNKNYRFITHTFIKITECHAFLVHFLSQSSKNKKNSPRKKNPYILGNGSF